MSASERLAALLNAAETAERGWDNDLHGEPLLMALPEIVAVVRAAEEADDEFNEKRIDPRYNDDDLMDALYASRLALAALDEKLADAG